MAAMQDEIAFANSIYALSFNTTEEIQRSFSEYQAERIPAIIGAYASSCSLANILGKGLKGRLPCRSPGRPRNDSGRSFGVDTLVIRPQIGFLPQVENRGSVVPNVSQITKRARVVYEER
ncbi:hypothetical protein BGX29_004406 [Mortierella sp. GBA35]|nr:hypothetical protein BGX29_004406 [Mortierella sp. GBA35]